MKNKILKEEIICGKCKKIIYKNVEVKEVNMRSKDLDNPLKIIIIKKFVCDNCGESKNYQVRIIKEKTSFK